MLPSESRLPSYRLLNLSVESAAKEAEIKTAFRRMALKLHPDKQVARILFC